MAGEKLQKMSSRFVVIVWVFVVLILTSSYSANLTSTKTISRIQLSDLGNIADIELRAITNNNTNTFVDYAQALRNGTFSFFVGEIPYLSVYLGHYPGIFDMTVRDTSSNGFGFVCASLQNPLLLHIGFSLLIYVFISDVPERFGFGS